MWVSHCVLVAAVLGLQPWRSADASASASSATTCGVFRWVPYSRDERMGLNHQMSSLSCAMNEAAYLDRTLLLPPTMCIDGGHNKKRGGSRCVPLESLFDLQLLHSFVPVRTSKAGLSARRQWQPARSPPGSEAPAMYRSETSAAAPSACSTSTEARRGGSCNHDQVTMV